MEWETFSSLQYFELSAVYIIGRALFFYTLFYFLYKALNKRLGIAKDLPSEKQLRNEKIENIKANLFEVLVLFLLLTSGILQFNDFTAARFVGTFFFCFFFFEVWFYFVHRLLHTKKFMWIHRTHHISVITNPMSALSLSIPEKILNDTGMLLIPCLLTRYFPLVAEGILAYHLYNFYINVLGHSNIELLPGSFARSKFGKLFTTSTYHSIHHIKGHANFGLFLTFLDKHFETFDRNYEQSYEKVIQSRGITRKELYESKSY